MTTADQVLRHFYTFQFKILDYEFQELFHVPARTRSLSVSLFILHFFSDRLWQGLLVFCIFIICMVTFLAKSLSIQWDFAQSQVVNVLWFTTVKLSSKNKCENVVLVKWLKILGSHRLIWIMHFPSNIRKIFWGESVHCIAVDKY